VIEEESEEQTEDELPDDRGSDDEDDRVDDHRRKIRIAEQSLVVLEADEPRARRVDADERLVREARVEGPQRRPDEEEREQDRRRRQTEEVRAVPAERARCGRGAGAKRPRSNRRAYSAIPTA
jgi:hypothetical protein